MNVDSVNHPSHYTSGKIEVIDFIDDQQLSYEKGGDTISNTTIFL